MRYFLFIVFIFLYFFSSKAKKSAFEIKSLTAVHNKKTLSSLFKKEVTLFKNRPSPIFRLFHEKQKNNRRITASVLAFPFPFGIVGLHRIYLGCSPYIPVVYIASLGGVFGALPLIDFFVLVIDKNTEHYVNNPQVFMWIN